MEPVLPIQEQSSNEATAVNSQLELPFGGRELSKFRFVALYGSPEFKGLGSLGEQPIEESVVRVKNQATLYDGLSTETVVPSFEIITTIASAGPTENDDYSQETDIEKIRPWVALAGEHGIYVVLDLQPGRSTFLQQAKLYEELLKEPHVGLALDPEWRLLSNSDRHLKKVGSVSSAEINETSEWLADIVKINELPQKIFLVHQFKLSMIQNRETLKTDREELSYIIHVDGFGTLGQKTETWNKVKSGLSEQVRLGWKNFYDEDKPTPSPEQTMQLTPIPTFISYQ